MIKKLLKKIRNKIIMGMDIDSLEKMGLKVGKNFNMQRDCLIDLPHCWLIEIGDNVTLAPRVQILAHDASTKFALNYTKIGRVNIGNNVFIGANTTILPNVQIGDNVIIGANSLVCKNLESNKVYAGNPAREICTYDDYIKKNSEKMKKVPIYSSEYTLRNKKITNEMKHKMKEELKNSIGYVK